LAEPTLGDAVKGGRRAGRTERRKGNKAVGERIKRHKEWLRGRKGR